MRLRKSLSSYQPMPYKLWLIGGINIISALATKGLVEFFSRKLVAE
jgi:hypothetical protein